jgi:alpha,alpha-trehalase
MRESGFDPSNRFGPFNIDIIHYNPICLNSLLYLMETETAEIMKTLGRARDANMWLGRAEQRKRRINRLMWNESDGLYYDYNFVEKRVRRHPFVTTFYPLWAGQLIAIRRLVAANLQLERPGGFKQPTKRQSWDAPFG